MDKQRRTFLSSEQVHLGFWRSGTWSSIRSSREGIKQAPRIRRQCSTGLAPPSTTLYRPVMVKTLFAKPRNRPLHGGTQDEIWGYSNVIILRATSRCRYQFQVAYAFRHEPGRKYSTPLSRVRLLAMNIITQHSQLIQASAMRKELAGSRPPDLNMMNLHP